jgi:hypothetical protein
MRKNLTISVFLAVASSSITAAWAADGGPAPVGYTDTPMLPGGKWHVHDPNRPQPTVVTPGTFSTTEAPGKPPSDAIVLFDGKDLSKWRTGDNQAPSWKAENGVMVVSRSDPKKGQDVYTREEFGDCQLHIEFATPNPTKGDSQGRGNSGVFFMDRYEFQVLDSFQNRTYADGSAASLYGQSPPLVNASRKPGEWQVYDIIFTAPRFKEGKMESPARVTAFHNGVLVQNDTAYLGPSGHKSLPTYKPHGAQGPIRLQDHGDPMRFRNIWIRRLDSTAER